jgi:hypothetical protein
MKAKIEYMMNTKRIIKHYIKALHLTIGPYKGFMHLVIHPQAQPIGFTSLHSFIKRVEL